MASQIFSGYRVLGLVTNEIPLCTRFVKLRKEHLVVTCVGKSFHTYSVKNLRLLSVSPPQEHDITAMAVDHFHVYTAHGKDILAWRRGHEIQHRYEGHEHEVHLMMTFGQHLISIDRDNCLKVWNIRDEGLYCSLRPDPDQFSITALTHPFTYLNKVVLGSRQGTLQLWNLEAGQLVKSYDHGWASAVTQLQQAPAKDVVAVGLRSGWIYLYNIRLSQVVIKLLQEYGSVMAISCRMDVPVMATSSPDGHIVIWDLEERKLVHQLLSAHSAPVSGLQFLSGEPVLLSSASDNALKMWLFDMPDGSGRLLSHRSGHALPPTRIRFYNGYGQYILSADLASSLHMFSTVADNLSKCLGQAVFNKKTAKRMKKRGGVYDGKLSAITHLASANQREKEWDNVVCLHQNQTMATTWTTNRGTMGAHKLEPERFHRSHESEQALCLSVSECGNYAVIGYSTGHMDKFNIQSGMHRGTFGSKEGAETAAHKGPVYGVVIDIYSQILVSGGEDCSIKFWKFKCPQEKVWRMLEVESSVEQMECHRESGLVAAILSDFDVIIVDMASQKVVRKFEGHLCKVLDLDFSPDARWLVTASQDRTIRVWNIPTACLIDCFLTETICTSLAFSPQSDFLATIHMGEAGVSLWVNTTLCEDVMLTPLPQDYAPRLLKLQPTGQEDSTGILAEGEEAALAEAAEYATPEQIEDLVSFTTLPTSRWKNILDIDLIIERNRPKEAPKLNLNLPFFLSELKTSTDNNQKNDKEKPVHKSSKAVSDFNRLLKSCTTKGDYAPLFDWLFTKSIVAVSIEIEYLSPTFGGSEEKMVNFLKGLLQYLKTSRNYNILAAYHACFIKTHRELAYSLPAVRTLLQAIEEEFTQTWPDMYKRYSLFMSHNHLKF